eukprot:COSAG06_NODE_1136_length_10570_cov_6.459555_8_plen_180_part_00
MLTLSMVDDREWYGSVMLALLLATFVPAVATLVYKSPVERVLISMQEIAMELPQPQPAPQGASPAASSVTSSDPEPSAAPPAVEIDNGIDLEASAVPAVAPDPPTSAPESTEREPESELQQQPEPDQRLQLGDATGTAMDEEAPTDAGAPESDASDPEHQPGEHTDDADVSLPGGVCED